MQLYVFSLELISLVVSVSRIFAIHEEHLLSGIPESVCYSFFWLQCVKQEFTLFVSLFLQKSDTQYLFPTNWILFNLLFKNFTFVEMKVWRHHLFNYLLFTILRANNINKRNRYEYCFIRFKKYPRERLQWNSQ